MTWRRPAIYLSALACKPRRWIPAARSVLHVPCTCTLEQTALALFVFRTSLTRQGHARREPERAGLFDLFLTNRRASWAERRSAAANGSRSRERPGPAPRVPDTRERQQLLCAGRQRAEAWKNSALTFSVDYKETGKAMQHSPIITGSQNHALIARASALRQKSST